MRLRLVRLLTLFLAVFSIAYFSVLGIYQIRGTESASERSQPEYQYILREYQGMLAAFTLDESEPFQVFPLFTDSLPEEDIRKLQEGIYAEDTAALQILIAEYTS